MRRETNLLMLTGMLAIGGVTPAASAQELVLLNGNHTVPVAAFGPSPELKVGAFVSPSTAGNFYFIAERDAFFHEDIDAMGGQSSTDGSAANAAGAATSSSSAGVASSASAGDVASAAGGAAGQVSVSSTPAAPQWRSVGAHAFDLNYQGATWVCMAGKISESEAGRTSSLGAGAADMADPRLYQVQCMGWTASE